jgi:hypothetical protein
MKVGNLYLQSIVLLYSKELALQRVFNAENNEFIQVCGAEISIFMHKCNSIRITKPRLPTY